MPDIPGRGNKRKRGNNATAGMAVLLPLADVDPHMSPHHHHHQHGIPHPHQHQHQHQHQHAPLHLDHHHHPDLDPHHDPEETVEVDVQHIATNHIGIPQADLAAPNSDDILYYLKPHKDCTSLVQQAILVSPLNPLTKKKSAFWQVFHQFDPKHSDNADRPHHACCNLCGKTINMGRDNSTTTLAQHLKKCNKDLWEKLKAVTVVKNVESHDDGDNNDDKSNHNSNGTNGLIQKLIDLEELRQYIKVAIVLRFKFPPEEEWPGLISILRKEIGNKLAKESIRDVFQQYCRRNRTKRANHNSNTTYHATVVSTTKRQRTNAEPPPQQQQHHQQHHEPIQSHPHAPEQPVHHDHHHHSSEIDDMVDDEVDVDDGIHHFHGHYDSHHHHTNTGIHNEGSDTEGRGVLTLDHSFAGL